VREIIEQVMITPTGLVEECWLRDNLTQDEWASYRRIVMQHRQLAPVAESMEVTLPGGRALIPPGAFLEDLKANGLVSCESRMTYDTSMAPGLSKPERTCI